MHCFQGHTSQVIAATPAFSLALGPNLTVTYLIFTWRPSHAPGPAPSCWVLRQKTLWDQLDALKCAPAHLACCDPHSGLLRLCWTVFSPHWLLEGLLSMARGYREVDALRGKSHVILEPADKFFFPSSPGDTA